MRPVLDEFLMAVAAGGLATPSHAQAPGTVSVVFATAGLIVGAGGGRGVLTYRGRDYPFRVSGLSLGIAIGASAMRLTGRVSGLRELKVFFGRRWRRRRAGRWFDVLSNATNVIRVNWCCGRRIVSQAYSR